MEIYPKAILSVLAASALLLPSHLQAGDKVHFSGSTSITVPKPNEVIKDSRRFRVNDGPSVRTEFEGSIPIITPLPSTSPQAEKKFREALDKEKNWIFINPYKPQFDKKTDDFLKGEKNSGLYNHPLMKEDDKSVVQQYVDERKPDRELGATNSENRSDPGYDRTEVRNYFAPDATPDPTDKKVAPGKALPPAFERNPFAAIEKSEYQKRLESSPLRDSIFGSVEKPSDRAYTREQREARDAEFSKLYQPPQLGGSSGGTAVEGLRGPDPLGSSFDPTRQELTPFSGRRSDQMFTGSGLPAASSRSSVSFTGPPLGSPSGSLNSSGRSSFDFAPKAAQQPSFAPRVSAPSQSSTPSFSPQPFILPRPQRKF